MTYTYALLDISAAAYAEIEAALRKASYDHAFHTDDGKSVIDMQGIALRVAESTERRCLFFGRKDIAGHHLYGDTTRVPAFLHGSAGSLDGNFAPYYSKREGDPLGNQPQGHAKLTYLQGWTVVSFWDRSGDTRGNSNSAFIVDAIVSFDDVMKLARRYWPAYIERAEAVAPIKLVQVGGL